jgi:hypothetical protein
LHAPSLIALTLTFVLPVSAIASPLVSAGEYALATVTVEQPEPTVDPTPAPHPVLVEDPQAQPVDEKPRYGRNHGLGWTFMGFGMFGTSYVINATVGALLIDDGNPLVGRPLMIPVVGPFLAGARMERAVDGFLVGFGGVFQVAGLAMGIAGAVMLGKARRANRLAAGPNGLVLQF